MLLQSFFRYLESHGPRTRAKGSRRRAAYARLSFEPLEGRALPSFVTAPSYAVDNSPNAVAVGDFNADGAPDLVTGNVSFGTISVLLANGDGTFQARTDYAAGSVPRFVVAADFNNDGTLDLATSGSLLLGNGDGTFQTARPLADARGALAVGDFNGDGLPDLATVSGWSVRVLLGNGDGTFRVAGEFAAGQPAPVFVAVGEFNGDGRPDLAVANTDAAGAVSVLLGNGDGTFGAALTFAAGTWPRSLAVGEFNGDGHQDIAVANFGSPDSDDPGSVSVLLGNGDGTFQTRVNYAVGFNPHSVAVGDWDGDGDHDLATANTRSNTVSILLGQENGTFQAGGTFAIGSLPVAVAVGDLDGDGDLDLAVADNASSGLGSPDVAVLLGNGDGTFVAPRSYAVGNHPRGVAVGDFNEDGLPDLATANYYGGTASVLLGTGTGTFQAVQSYAVGTEVNSVAVGDYNSDGHQDLALACTSGARVLLGLGDGTFGFGTSFATFFHTPRSVAAGDFNGDGALDLALTLDVPPGDEKVAVLLGVGNGTFLAAVGYAAGYGVSSVAVGDFNRDGFLDLTVANGLGVGVLLGNGDGTFRPRTDFPAGVGPRHVAVGEFNGDGQLDLAVTNSSPWPGAVSVLLGNGDGTFQAERTFPVGSYQPRSMALGDFNGDGHSDLAVIAALQPGRVSVLLGLGDGTFLAPANYVAGTDMEGVAVGDFSGDGFPDLAVTNGGQDTVTVLLNEGASVTINQALGQADPTAGSTISFDVVFSVPVTGFEAVDIDLSASTVGGTLVAEVTGMGSVYTVTVTGMDRLGTVLASIPAGAAIVGLSATTQASTSTDNTVTFDGVPPAVTIDQAAGQADPTTVGPITFTVHFSEVVSGFDGSDISFAGSTGGGTLVAGVTGAGADYTVTVTGMTGQGTVIASIPAGAATDAIGNGSSASTSTDNTVVFDTVPPSITIIQAVGQSDPTNIASIKFDVKFSEPVTGFDVADVSLAGSTAGGTLSISVTGSGDTYTVTVTGMTTRGFVVASIPAGGAADAAGNASLASSSTDNAVEFRNTGTVGFTRAVYDTTEDAGTVTVTVTRAGQTDGAVSVRYGTGDGTAHAGTDYTTTSGTLSWADGVGGDRTFTIDILPDARNEGKELITLTLTDPAGSPGLGRVGATVAIAPSDGQGPGTYLDQDGDKYTIRLTGRTGSLLYFRTDPDEDGRGPIELIELTGTLPDPLKPKATLVVAVARARTSADGGTVGLGAVTGPGLRSITARRATLNLEGISLNGYLGSLVIGNVVNGADITTLATSNPLQRTRVNALAIGDGTAIDIGSHVSSLTAASFGAGSVRAPSVGTMVIRGPMAADVTITGAGVDPSKKALTALRVRGAVMGSDIRVAGNVGTVAVGAFRDSRLFVGYMGPDDGSGTFNFPATVATFRVTGKVDGFQNSRVIATTFKSVTLTSVDSTNPASPFGFYADTSLGAVTVIGPTKWKYDPALSTPQGVGDFEVKIV